MIQTLKDAANASPASEAENDRLYLLLADPKAREALIVNNVRLLQSMVAHFTRRHPQFAHLEDELLAEGLGQLAIVAGTLTKTDCDCPTAYIIYSIRNCLYVTARNAKIIRVPRHNSTPPPRVKLNPGLLDGLIDEELWSDFRRQQLIEEICTSEEERKIVALRLSGHTYREVEQKSGLARSTIHRRIAHLRKSFLKLQLFSRDRLPGRATY